ncbi:MAG: hypothetical protein ABJE95_03920 [Byssovorax sp.]
MVRNVSWLNASRYGWFVVVGALLAGKDACLGGAKRPVDPVPPVAPTVAPTAPTPPTPPTPPEKLPPPG